MSVNNQKSLTESKKTRTTVPLRLPYSLIVPPNRYLVNDIAVLADYNLDSIFHFQIQPNQRRRTKLHLHSVYFLRKPVKLTKAINRQPHLIHLFVSWPMLQHIGFGSTYILEETMSSSTNGENCKGQYELSLSVWFNRPESSPPGKDFKGFQGFHSIWGCRSIHISLCRTRHISSCNSANGELHNNSTFNTIYIAVY